MLDLGIQRGLMYFARSMTHLSMVLSTLFVSFQDVRIFVACDESVIKRLAWIEECVKRLLKMKPSFFLSKYSSVYF